MEYTKENPLRCFFAFEGYNSQGLALNRLKQNYPDFDWVCVGRSEIDKYAIQAADALFPEARDKNYGDISKIDWNDVPDFDLFTMSSPCQDFSQSGLQKGGAEGSGTRSSLLWECRRAILAKKPKYIVFENVKALVSQKFLPYFLKWQNELASYGYSNFAKVLNARDFGIPQNRERIFMVSIFDENASYHFPEPFPLDKRLKDVLEEDVDEKYYLSKKIIDTFIERNKINEDKGNGFKFEPTDGDCVASAVLTRSGSRSCDNYIKEFIANVGGEDKLMVVGNIFPSRHSGGKIYDTKGISPTVMERHNNAVTIVEPIACAMRGREVQCLTTKRTEYGKKVRKEYESGELKESRHNMQQLEPRTEGVCNTITSVQKDCLIIEPKILSYTRDANGKVVDRHFKDVANTIHGATGGGGGNTDSFVIELANKVKDSAEKSRGMELGVSIDEYGNIRVHRNDEKKSGISESVVTSYRSISPTQISARPNMIYDEEYRIRKLTERECFRLMDVDDEDIDKIQASGISRSQQYKLAGNSICVNVLYHIFRKLFVKRGNESRCRTLF